MQTPTTQQVAGEGINISGATNNQDNHNININLTTTTSNSNTNTSNSINKGSNSCSNTDTRSSSDSNSDSNSNIDSNRISISNNNNSSNYATSNTNSTNIKQARRKVSVFSHDGFPNIHQLDQQTLRQRCSIDIKLDEHTHLPEASNTKVSLSSAAVAVVCPSTNSNVSAIDVASSSPNTTSVVPIMPLIAPCNGNTSTTIREGGSNCIKSNELSAQPVVLVTAAGCNSSRSNGSSPQLAMTNVSSASSSSSSPSATCSSSTSVDSKSRRSARSDTLGSTGSSRASSCDEPPTAMIVVPEASRCQELQASQNQDNRQLIHANKRVGGPLVGNLLQAATSDIVGLSGQTIGDGKSSLFNNRSAEKISHAPRSNEDGGGDDDDDDEMDTTNCESVQQEQVPLATTATNTSRQSNNENKAREEEEVDSIISDGEDDEDDEEDDEDDEDDKEDTDGKSGADQPVCSGTNLTGGIINDEIPPTKATTAKTTTTASATTITAPSKATSKAATATASSSIPPPFESIKMWLKPNSTPNAQFIQRHIDNLISQNTEIVENKNLVNIRSYNSSRSDSQASSQNIAPQAQPTPSQHIATTTAPSTATSSTTVTMNNLHNNNPLASSRRWPSGSLSSNGQLHQIAESMASGSFSLATSGGGGGGRPRKRWSTSTAPLSSNLFTNCGGSSSSGCSSSTMSQLSSSINCDHPNVALLKRPFSPQPSSLGVGSESDTFAPTSGVFHNRLATSFACSPSSPRTGSPLASHFLRSNHVTGRAFSGAATNATASCQQERDDRLHFTDRPRPHQRHSHGPLQQPNLLFQQQVPFGNGPQAANLSALGANGDATMCQSASVPSSPEPTNLPLELHQYLSSRLGGNTLSANIAQQPPSDAHRNSTCNLHVESGMENLLLKRMNDELLRQHQLSIFNQQQQLHAQGQHQRLSTSGAPNRQDEQQHHHHQIKLDSAQELQLRLQLEQNLILNQQQRQDDLLMAALFLEGRQREQQLLAASGKVNVCGGGGAASGSQGPSAYASPLNADQNLEAALVRLQQHQHQHQQESLSQQHLEQLRLRQLAASIDNENQRCLATQAAGGHLPEPQVPNSPRQQQPPPPSQHHHHHQRQHRMSCTAARPPPIVQDVQQMQHRASLGSTDLMSQRFLREHQALESHLLNEFLAKMMLNRPADEQQQQQQQILTGLRAPHDATMSSRGVNAAQLVSGVGNLEHGPEMQTQSLDSATPAHRCDACDISFWTKDLLNYHLMTQCSARNLSTAAGAAPARPLAFSFSAANGFDTCQVGATSGVGVVGSAVGVPGTSTSLPFKKRKISEPNMRY